MKLANYIPFWQSKRILVPDFWTFRNFYMEYFLDWLK